MNNEEKLKNSFIKQRADELFESDNEKTLFMETLKIKRTYPQACCLKRHF